MSGHAIVRTLGGVTECVLNSNGLKVLVLPDHSSPTATFMITYLVGSRDEGAGFTGATHFLEHMMFKDTEGFSAAQGNRLDQYLESVGARYNASTWLDRTNYHATVGREHLESCIRVEAGRMRGLLLKDEECRTESGVILDELQRGQTNPRWKLMDEMQAAAFTAHPYHHPVIGWACDVANANAEKLRRFYDDFYWPDNAVASVIGDVTVPDALALVEKYYGGFPKAPKPFPPMLAVEPAQLGPRRVTVRRAGELGIVGIGFKSPPATHPDYPAIDLLCDILTDGKNSRLYRALVDKKLAASVSASSGFFRDASLLSILAVLVPGVKHGKAESVVLREIERIKTKGVTPREAGTAIAKAAARTAYARDGSYSVASQLNESIAAGDWTLFANLPEAVKKVTPDDVQRVARTYLVEDQGTTGWFVPVAGLAAVAGVADPGRPASARPAAAATLST